MAYAIEKEAIEEDDDDSDMDALYETYRAFRKKVCKSTPDPDYCLAEYCDIPDYRKSEIEIEYKNSLQKDKVQATKLQCGLVSVESAIKDYINRYAYPIKVRDLLETFEDILDDVNSFTNATLAQLKQAKVELGEKNGERKEVSRRKENAEEKKVALEVAQEKINMKLEELNGIEFDFTELHEAMQGFMMEIHANEDVKYFNKNANRGINTGQKSHEEVEADIVSRVNRIKNFIDNKLCEINKVLESIKNQYDNQIKKVFEVVKVTVGELEKTGTLNQGEYKFTDSVWWKVTFGNISSEQLISDVKTSIVDRTTKIVQTRNKKKAEWRSSGNPFKRLGSLFMDDYIETEKKINGFYKAEKVTQCINTYLNDLHCKSMEMEEEAKQNLEIKKQEINSLVNRICQEVEAFLEDIKKQEILIEGLSDSIENLDKEINKSNELYCWLNSLKTKIEEE